MKYNYCPLCGQELPRHHHGKYCKKCAAKVRRKKLIRTAVGLGVTVGVGAVTASVISANKKEITRFLARRSKNAAIKTVKQLPSQGAALLHDAAGAAKLAAGTLQKRVEVPVSPETVKAMLQPGLERGRIRIVEIFGGEE